MKPQAKVRRLVSLESHSLAAMAAWRPAIPSGRNGLACPQCGSELADNGKSVPVGQQAIPQVYVACDGCDFRGTRLLFPDEAAKR